MEEIIKLLRETKAGTDDMAGKIEEITRKMESLVASLHHITLSIIQFRAAVRLMIRDGLIDAKELNDQVEELLRENRSRKM